MNEQELRDRIRAAIAVEGAAPLGRRLGMSHHTLCAIAAGAPCRRGSLLAAEEALRKVGMLTPKQAAPVALSTAPVPRA